jgi:hypothetical protein
MGLQRTNFLCDRHRKHWSVKDSSGTKNWKYIVERGKVIIEIDNDFKQIFLLVYHYKTKIEKNKNKHKKSSSQQKTAFETTGLTRL